MLKRKTKQKQASALWGNPSKITPYSAPLFEVSFFIGVLQTLPDPLPPKIDPPAPPPTPLLRQPKTQFDHCQKTKQKVVAKVSKSPDRCISNILHTFSKSSLSAEMSQLF